MLSFVSCKKYQDVEKDPGSNHVLGRCTHTVSMRYNQVSDCIVHRRANRLPPRVQAHPYHDNPSSQRHNLTCHPELIRQEQFIFYTHTKPAGH